MSKRIKKRMTRTPLILGMGLVFILLALVVCSDRAVFTSARQLVASVFFVDSSTPTLLHAKYEASKTGGPKIKILVVPGHDNDYSGAAYGGLREADLTRMLGDELGRQFASSTQFEVTLARDKAGYLPALQDYFTTHRANILSFIDKQKAQMNTYLSSGAMVSNVAVNHNFAPQEVAIKLFGINMWASEQHYDLVVHLHFNDVPRKVLSKPGPYTGFVIYVPEHQFSNAKGSLAVAQAIFPQLALYYPTSSMPLESPGIVEDQELIATGRYNSADMAVVLIEYAYIYEPVVQKSAQRTEAFQRMAHQTVLGIQNFFNSTVAVR